MDAKFESTVPFEQTFRSSDGAADGVPEKIPAKTSLRGLDAVRAVAVVAVVALHSGSPYLTHDMPGLVLAVRDTPSPTVDFAFWSIELVVMPLFLIIAGFLAAQTLQRRDPISLVRHRGKRLLIPLAFAIVVVLPLDLYAWVLGWVTDGLVAPIKLKSLKFDGVIDRDLWGLSHLWFLQYLFQYIVLLAAGAMAIERSSLLGRMKLKPHSVATALLCIAVTVLLFRPQVVWGFQHAFAPVPSKWIYHAAFFFAGVAVAYFDPQWARMSSTARRWIGPVIAASIAAVWLGQWHLSGLADASVVADSVATDRAGFIDWSGITLAMFTAISAMTVCCFAIAMAVTNVRSIPKWCQYLAAASFWVYLVHHPLLGLIHIDLKYLLPGVSPVVKAIASLAISLSISLLMYESFVRRTRLGRWLGMTFDFAPETGSESPHSQSVSAKDQANVPTSFSIQTAFAIGSVDDRPRRAA